MSSERPLRAGLCGIGLEAYWSQFAGFEERLKGYVAHVASRLTRPGVEVVNLGLIDAPQRSLEAGHQCRREDIDVLFLYVTTYALSNTALPLVQRAGPYRHCRRQNQGTAAEGLPRQGRPRIVGGDESQVRTSDAAFGCRRSHLTVQACSCGGRVRGRRDSGNRQY